MAAKSPGPMLWTPRLHPFAEDEEVWLQEPFKTTFTSRNTRISTRHQIDTSWERLTTELLQAPDWAEWAWDWLAYCIGEDVTSKIPEHLLSQALELILNVLYLRFSIVEAQMANLSRLIYCWLTRWTCSALMRVDIPAEYSWFDDLDRRDDRESDWEDVDSDSDSDSGSNYSSDEQMPPVIDDDEPMPGSEVEEEYSSDAYVPNFTQFSAAPAPRALPMKKKPKFSVAPDLRRTQKDVVNDLVNMRLLPKKIWNTPAFQMALEMSGLLDKMYEISKPGNLLETSHTDVLESFPVPQLEVQLPELICKWTPATISLEDYEAGKARPNYSFDKDDTEELLCFISSHPRMHPWAFNPMAVFFLLSLDCFKFYSEIWLALSLHTLQYPNVQVRYENPETLGMKWIKPRNHVYSRCGRDITRFYFVHEDDALEWVGGVRYNAMRRKILEYMIDNHRRVRVRSVPSSGGYAGLAYGSMTAAGSRQPLGGRHGDIYGPYARHRGDTPDDIKALFRHAVDADILVEIGATIVPTLRSDINEISKTSEAHRLGRYGITSFYCSNYISAVHPDFDFGRQDIKRDSKKSKERRCLLEDATLVFSWSNRHGQIPA
ncbi:hypothetical protein B0H17DRAFT_1216743 [Mycena rosella]|uniref:Uncharacterized protein n=1 Tax=Mycena rosella TaxID=1033263 RepID=A0AAD7C682_MYCRO|nr:hypothetical protein B0H17DRAFT_1216743 [Mycena rosella]